VNASLVETRGTVICVHRLGATVRLEDGSLAAVPASEVAAHQGALTASLRRREAIPLVLEVRGRRKTAFIARAQPAAPPATPVLFSHDSLFEEQMRRYLKATEEWAPPDRPEPAQRHLVRKRRRAAYFEARTRAT
jgi:hypothetical protein